MIVYNDFKNKDWLEYKGGLPKGTIIIINNETKDRDVIAHLQGLGYIPYYSTKLCEDDYNHICMDCENYHNDINYSKSLGESIAPVNIVFPENLGGDKYEGYDDFLEGVNPYIVLMERTYNEFYPWKLLMYWNRNKYLRDMGIKVYIGIWQDAIPKWARPIQLFFAKLISGNNVFWYSEDKNLPK